MAAQQNMSRLHFRAGVPLKRKPRPLWVARSEGPIYCSGPTPRSVHWDHSLKTSCPALKLLFPSALQVASYILVIGHLPSLVHLLGDIFRNLKLKERINCLTVTV